MRAPDPPVAHQRLYPSAAKCEAAFDSISIEPVRKP
jgi:hypothetical protein